MSNCPPPSLQYQLFAICQEGNGTGCRPRPSAFGTALSLEVVATLATPLPDSPDCRISTHKNCFRMDPHPGTNRAAAPEPAHRSSEKRTKRREVPGSGGVPTAEPGRAALDRYPACRVAERDAIFAARPTSSLPIGKVRVYSSFFVGGRT